MRIRKPLESVTILSCLLFFTAVPLAAQEKKPERKPQPSSDTRPVKPPPKPAAPPAPRKDADARRPAPRKDANARRPAESSRRSAKPAIRSDAKQRVESDAARRSTPDDQRHGRGSNVPTGDRASSAAPADQAESTPSVNLRPLPDSRHGFMVVFDDDATAADKRSAVEEIVATLRRRELQTLDEHDEKAGEQPGEGRRDNEKVKTSPRTPDDGADDGDDTSRPPDQPQPVYRAPTRAWSGFYWGPMYRSLVYTCSDPYDPLPYYRGDDYHYGQRYLGWTAIDAPWGWVDAYGVEPWWWSRSSIFQSDCMDRGMYNTWDGYVRSLQPGPEDEPVDCAWITVRRVDGAAASFEVALPVLDAHTIRELRQAIEERLERGESVELTVTLTPEDIDDFTVERCEAANERGDVST